MTELVENQDVEGYDCSPCCENDRLRYSLGGLSGLPRTLMAQKPQIQIYYRNAFVSISLGQILSLCLCGSALTSQLLNEKYEISTPTAQSFTNYFLLCLVYGTILSCRPPESGVISVFRKRGWKYLVIAVIDVEANYLVVAAYQHTNLTSIQLLDCFTIPVVLLLSWLCLSTRYQISHVIGVGLCLVGVGCLVRGDIILGRGSIAGGSNRLLGDLLCMAGAALYGICNVGEEVLVKNFSRIEYLGMIGLFGSIISGVQLSVMERDSIVRVRWSDLDILMLYLGFAIAMFVFYSLVTVVMERSSATLFNLAIQSADFYVMLLSFFLFRYPFHFLYVVSFVVMLIGSIIYSIKPPPTGRSEGFLSCCCPKVTVPDDTRNSDSGAYSKIGREAREEDQVDIVVKYCPVHGTVVVPKRKTEVDDSSSGRMNTAKHLINFQ